MRKYKLISKKGEGTFAEVIKAENIQTGTLHAIKCMKTCYKNTDEVKRLREIEAIKRLSPHPNVVKLEEVLFDPPSGRLALVFELMEANLYEMMKDRNEQHEVFSKDTVKSFMRQIFTALDHMHSKGVFHRDIKPENILVDKSGRRLKLADFGSCRGINGTPPFTEYISTRWYRSPECLLTCGSYGPEMDVWGAGCILFELTTLYPLFPGADEPDQISRIHRVLGTPKNSVLSKLRLHASTHVNFHFPRQVGIGLNKLLPDAESKCLDFLTQTLHYDKSDRITSRKALKHPYFVGEIQASISNSKSNIGNKSKNRILRKHHVHPTPSTTLPPVPVVATKHTSKPISKPAAKAYGKQEHRDRDEDENDETALPKTRSMVSILLARSTQKDFVQESKDRNKTFYRKGKNINPSGKTSTKLPDIAPPTLPEPKQKSKKSSNLRRYTRRQPKQYEKIKSSGYGYGSSTTTQRDPTETLPLLGNTGERVSKASKSKEKTKTRKGPNRLGRGFR